MVYLEFTEKLFVLGKPGPFQIIEGEGSGNVDSPVAAPRRRYSCPNYTSCLDLAAALNWDNFTCRGCSGEINEALQWRAHQVRRKDTLVETLCELPSLASTTSNDFKDGGSSSFEGTRTPREIERKSDTKFPRKSHHIR